MSNIINSLSTESIALVHSVVCTSICKGNHLTMNLKQVIVTEVVSFYCGSGLVGFY